MNVILQRVAGWRAFAVWALVGALLCFSVLASASIGLFLLPVVLLVWAVAASRVRIWPEIVGALEGVAAVVVVIGILNLGSTPCPSSGSGVVLPSAPTSETACGGIDPLPWLAIGLVLAGVGLVVHLLDRVRS